MEILKKNKISIQQLGALQFAANGSLRVGGCDPEPINPRTPQSLAKRGLMKLVGGGYFFWEYELTPEGRALLEEIETERKKLVKPEPEWEPLPDYTPEDFSKW